MAATALQIINKIIDTGSTQLVKSKDLSIDNFKPFEEELKFILEHEATYGNVPDPMTFLFKFPNFSRFEVNETDAFLLQNLYEEISFTNFSRIIPTLNDYLKKDSRIAFDYLMQELPTLKPKSELICDNIIADAKARAELYHQIQELGDQATIKSGLPELDAVLNGWALQEEFVTIVARTNVGKSWILMKFLTEAWKQGKRVGLYSGEMSGIKLGYRFDSLFKHFSNMCLTRGIPVQGYDEYIDTLSNLPTPFFIVTPQHLGGRATVPKLRRFCEAKQIEILGVDQYSLMEDARAGKNDPPRTKLGHIAEDLFLMSGDLKLPIIGLAQANRAGIKADTPNETPGIENIKESDDISHNSTKVIGMTQNKEEKTMVLDIHKNREGQVGKKLIYKWNIDTGTYEYIPSIDDAQQSKNDNYDVKKAVAKAETAQSYMPF